MTRKTGRKGSDQEKDVEKQEEGSLKPAELAELARHEGLQADTVAYEDVPTASGVKVFCAFDKIVSLTSLVPNPRNPNKHPERQIQILAKIIMNQGWRAPVTVSLRSGFIVRGGGRYEAAKLMQVDDVPVDYQQYASDAEEWADLIADNRIAELSQMDTGLLKDILVDMNTGAFDMDLTGFDDKSLEALMTIEGGPPSGDDMPEHDEHAADGVKTVTCPKCGEEFPVT
jgi:hypothetical protein